MINVSSGVNKRSYSLNIRRLRVRNIAVQMYMSIDGVMEAPEKWSFRYWTDDHEKYDDLRLLRCFHWCSVKANGSSTTETP